MVRRNSAGALQHDGFDVGGRLAVCHIALLELLQILLDCLEVSQLLTDSVEDISELLLHLADFALSVKDLGLLL